MIRRACVAAIFVVGTVVASTGSSVAQTCPPQCVDAATSASGAAAPIPAAGSGSATGPVFVVPPPDVTAPTQEGPLTRGSAVGLSWLTALGGVAVLLVTLALVIQRRIAWSGERPTAPEPVPATFRLRARLVDPSPAPSPSPAPAPFARRV